MSTSTITVPAAARMSRKTVPTREERDHLLNVVYGDDTRPPRCQVVGHVNAVATRRECESCAAFDRWRSRMCHRFSKRGLKLTFDEYAYADPQPPPCPLGHSYAEANYKVCDHCKASRNWKKRQHRRMRREGVDVVFTDWDTLLAHLHQLCDAGMTGADIGRAAGCADITVYKILKGPAGGAKFVSIAVARRLLAVPMPERRLRLVPNAVGARLRRVDATGTHRRVRAACRAGHSFGHQGRRLGWAAETVRHWLLWDTVSVEIADAVADLFPTLISRPGSNRSGVATMSARKGWTEARYFSATNIDDPAYDPFAIVTNPVGVYRQLRALAWMGQGPLRAAEFIGESPEQVEIWMEGGPAPAYARHMVDAAFEALSGTFGPDDQLAERARRLGWAPPLAWYDVDVDNVRARPRIDLPHGARKTDYPLDSQVLQALMGRVPAAELLHAEKVRVVRILHEAGWSDRRIGAWLKWNVDGDLDKAAAAVCTFRNREEITGAGIALHGPSLLDAGRIVEPSAA